MTQYAAIMLAAGIGVPILAALNAALGKLIGSPTAAAVILFAIAFAASALVMLLFPGLRSLVQSRAGPETPASGRRSDRVLRLVDHPCRAAFRRRQRGVLCFAGAVDQHCGH